MLSIIIPANNEETLISACLESVLASNAITGDVEIILAANGCTDDTVSVAEDCRGPIEARNWDFIVLNLPQGGKLAALNEADAIANGEMRAYLDADVTVSPPLLPGVVSALAQNEPAYASGKVRITGVGQFSRLYARLWSKVPFMTENVPGCGLFAVNNAGRARWAKFPEIISDDTFVRLQFSPAERYLVDAHYDWPIAEGFSRLVRVRRRQDTGVDEIREKYPQILENDGTPGLGLSGYARLALGDPLGFVAYVAVTIAVKFKGPEREWSRSR